MNRYWISRRMLTKQPTGELQHETGGIQLIEAPDPETAGKVYETKIERRLLEFQTLVLGFEPFGPHSWAPEPGEEAA